MSAIIEVFRRISVRSGDSNLLDYGSITTAESPTTCAGTPILRPREITLAAGASMKLWDFTVDGAFAIFVAECSAFAWIATKVDAPVSSSDPTEAGTAINYPKEGLSCVGPLIIQGMAIPVVPSATNYAASAFHASTVNGRRYEIWAKNPSETDAINITYMWTL